MIGERAPPGGQKKWPEYASGSGWLATVFATVTDPTVRSDDKANAGRFR